MVQTASSRSSLPTRNTAPRKLVSTLSAGLRYFHLPHHVRSVVGEVRRRRLTYLPAPKLIGLVSTVQANERQRRSGIVIEAGCALGGSAVAMCAAKAQHRELRVYDVFGMIPPPTEQDGPDVHERYESIRSGRSKGIKGDDYYGYMDNLYDTVRENFAALGYPVERHNVSLIRGLVQDTLHMDEPVSLAHIDVDWYEPVLVCLQRIEPHLTAGGRIVLDDYFAWSGCRRAAEEYFADKDPALYRFEPALDSLIVVKRA